MFVTATNPCRIDTDLIKCLLPLPIYRTLTTTQPGTDVYGPVKERKYRQEQKLFFFFLIVYIYIAC